MKRTLSLSIVPFVLALGACSSSNNNSGSSSSAHADAGAGVDSGHPPAADGATPANDAGSDASTSSSSGDGDGGADAGSTDDGSAASPDDGNTTTPYTAMLTGAQVVPPVVTGATGTGTFALSADGTVLTYTIAFSGLSSPWASVDVHVGSAVDNTGISRQFFPGEAGATAAGTSGTVTGSFALSMAANADELDQLPIGGVYVAVPTAAHPGGEIRSQILSPGDEVLVAKLTPQQDVPPQSGTATAAAAFVLTGGGSTVRYHVSATGFSPSGIDWGKALGGQPINTGSVGNGLNAMVDGTIDIGDPVPWESGQIYLSMLTGASSTTIRGQVIAPGETLFTSTLGRSAAAPTSTVTGAAQVILDPSNRTVRYEVDSSSTNITGVFLNFGAFPGAASAGGADAGDAATTGGGSADAGADGDAGSSSVQLTIMGGSATDQTPDGGGGVTVAALPLTPAQVQSLKAGTAWINVETTSVPSGEIQGLLVAQ